MTDPIIAPVDDEWQSPARLEADIIAWETANRTQLPPAYRAFLLQYNGGRPYPNVFDLGIPDVVWGSADKQTFLDVLYDFGPALQIANGETYGGGTPRGFFFIGCTPGGIEILLSLRPTDKGAIYCWQGTDMPWGVAPNDDSALHLQAPAFADFVAALYDTPDRIGHDYWHSPRHEMLARPLKVS
jgi:hypothetical protein